MQPQSGESFVDPATDDDIPDGTQVPIGDDMPDEEGDAGVGELDSDDVDVHFDTDIYAKGDDD